MSHTGAEMIWEVLLREGVDVVFGYPGGAILPAYDALTKYPSIRHVLVRHEQGAAHMADGYARASGKVGVAIATSGPGATNLITGIATAMMDSSPMVCITGQVPSAMLGRDAFQETDVTGVALPITKHAFLVTKAEDIESTLTEAFALARGGRPGPVLVDITKDAQVDAVTMKLAPRPRTSSVPPNVVPVTQAQVSRAAEMIDAAKRPVILAGQGVVSSGSAGALAHLAETGHIPTALTLLALGALPPRHPMNLGMMGMHGEAWVNQAIQEADLLVALGMRFDDRVTGHLARYAPNAKKIHVDIDPSELNKNVKVDIGIVADVAEVLPQLTEQLSGAARAEWTARVSAMKADAGGHALPEHDDGRLHAEHVIGAISDATGGDAIIVTDVGQHQMWAAQYYRNTAPRRHLTSGGLGTMGFALPAAIGARFADPDAEIWVIAGDGGFQMTACELSTCAQEGLRLNIAIVNNGFLGMVRQWQEFFYDKRYTATPMVSPDFVQLANAHGLVARAVEERDELQDTIAWARETAGTKLVDFRVHEETSVYPMVPSGHALDEMIRRPGRANGSGREKTGT